MKKILIAAFLILTPALIHAWPRLGTTATAVFRDTGASAQGFSVSIGSGTARFVYSGQDQDREVFFQNPSATYAVHCGTSSAVTDNTGTSRWILRAGQDYTTNGTYDVWCVAEDGAGATQLEVIGAVEFDHKDIGR